LGLPGQISKRGYPVADFTPARFLGQQRKPLRLNHQRKTTVGGRKGGKKGPSLEGVNSTGFGENHNRTVVFCDIRRIQETKSPPQNGSGAAFLQGVKLFETETKNGNARALEIILEGKALD